MISSLSDKFIEHITKEILAANILPFRVVKQGKGVGNIKYGIVEISIVNNIQATTLSTINASLIDLNIVELKEFKDRQKIDQWGKWYLDAELNIVEIYHNRELWEDRDITAAMVKIYNSMIGKPEAEKIAECKRLFAAGKLI